MARLLANAQIHGYTVGIGGDLSVVGVKVSTFYFFFYSLLLSPSVLAQNGRISASARKLYDSAERLLPFDREQALKLYKKTIETDSSFAAPYMRIGQLLFDSKETKEEAYLYFEKAIKNDSNERAFLRIYEILGKQYLQKGDYSKAEAYFKGYVRLSPQPKSSAHRSVLRYLKQCEYAQYHLPPSTKQGKHQRLSFPINKALAQSYPVLSADLQTLIYTHNNGDEDIFVSKRTLQGWTEPKSVSGQINKATNEGTCSISSDGNVLVFTACHRKTNIGKCDLYISHKTGNAWSEPINLGPTVNSQGWQSQPALSADGTVLYFSSDRQGGLGGKDIWCTSLNTFGEWRVPINLGAQINTEFDEISPFIHSNNQTLFFASDGWQSVGGFDIFISKKEYAGWTTPQNLGFPLNDFADQMGFYITPDCQEAFYSYHDRSVPSENGAVVSSLCHYSLPDSLKQLCPAMTFVKGRVVDSETKRPLKAMIGVSEKEEQIATFYSDDSTGVFLFVVSPQAKTQVEVKRKNYLSQHFNLRLAADSSFQNGTWEILLTPIKVDSNLVLQHTLFTKNSSALLVAPYSALEHLAEYLKQNLATQLIIEGHTDDVGTAEANYTLSLQRAEAVKRFLLEKGIEEQRLRVKGYGKSRPLVQHGSEQARQQNRRVECKIVQ